MGWKDRWLPEERRPRLKQLLAQGKRLRAIEFHDPLSAVIGEAARVERGQQTVEFDLLWASGFANATAMALPDRELSLTERRIDALADVLTVTRKPMIVDLDTGRDALNLATLCARLEMLGASAVVVEDKCGAKQTSLAPDVNHILSDAGEFVAKLATAKSLLRTEDLMIFARTEALIAGASLDEALARARRYLESSADGLVIHSKDPSGDEILGFLRRLHATPGVPGKPIVCIPTAYNHLTDTELFENGAHIVIHANHLVRAAFQAMSEAAELILTHDRSREADRVCAPLGTIFKTLGV